MQQALVGTSHLRPTHGITARRTTAKCYCNATLQTRSPTTRRSSSFAGQGLRGRVVVVAPTSRASRGRTTSVNVQANLFTRISRVIKSYVNQLVSSYEDPEKLLDRLVDEMTSDSIRMRQASAQAIASHRQMDARAQNMQAGADQWLRRAELAVQQGQDELAREALARRKTMQADADRMIQQATAQKQACDQLSGSVRMLESKIAEAKGKKETLKARAASAKSSMAIQEMIGGLRSTSSTSFAAFEKMEEKVMALEAESESVAAMSAPDALEARFNMLEGSGGVEEELQALKAGRGKQQPASLPRPRINDVLQRNPTEIDRELEELRQRARQ